MIAGGWLKDPKIISNLFSIISSFNFNFPNIIHDSAIISSNVELGSGIQIFVMCLLVQMLRLGMEVL